MCLTQLKFYVPKLHEKNCIWSRYNFPISLVAVSREKGNNFKNKECLASYYHLNQK